MAKTVKAEKPKRIRKTLQGVVVSTKMQKTLVVRVETKYSHPLYGKIIKVHKKYKVHCEDSSVKDGDTIIIEECKPMSRDKSFKFVAKVEKK